MPSLKLSDALTAEVARLEREHGQARVLLGDERRQAAITLGVTERWVIIDIGGGNFVMHGCGEMRTHTA